MDYRILGPLEVKDGDRPLALGGEKQRAVLAVLLLHAGEVVSADRLIDDLWEEHSPPGAPKALQAHISRLRKALDANGAGSHEPDGEPSGTSSNGVLVTRGHGYLLRVEPGELDLDRFQAVVEAGRQALAMGDPQRASDILGAGLALWRGPPLADFAYEAFAQGPIAELEELRLGALEDRIEADLALGRHEQLVGELTALVKENPLRERPRMQLMLALYRCGRQAEALDVYQEHRRGLAAELGLDPGPRLQRLEAAILSRDASLDAPSGNGAPTELKRPAPSTSQSVDHRGRGIALGGLALVALVTAAVLVMTSTRGGSSSPEIATDSVGALSPSAGSIVGQAPVGSSPRSLAAGGGAVWATTSDNTLTRIDPTTRAVVQSIPVGSNPSGVAVGARAVWVANNLSDSVSRIDPTAGRLVQTITVGNAPVGIAVGYGSVWVANRSDGTIGRIDDVSGDVLGTIPAGGGVDGVTTGYKSVWVSDETGGRVLRIDPRTGQVTQTIGVGTAPTAIAAGDGAVWVANSQDGTVSKIDPQTNTLAAVIGVGDGPDAIAVGAGGVWVANEFGGTLSLINPATATVRRTTRLGNGPVGLAISDGQVWVGAQAPVTSHRGGTLLVLSHLPFGSLDPASPNNGGSLASGVTLPITSDGLTTFNRVGGSGGVQVVPDLAVSLPTPTDGGLTYTFQLRTRIRYSNGQPVRPEDFRRELERLAVLNPGFAFAEYSRVVGMARCLAHPGHCNLADGIVADDAANTIAFHLVTPDPEFPYRISLVFAVPAATPVRDFGAHPLPTTGPYEVVTDTGHEVVLVRNPYFHEWSRAAQPDGYPDRIVWRLGGSVEADVTAVEHNHADYTLDPPPPDRLQELQTRFASQLNVNPNPVTDGLSLNTRVAPFNDVRVRRAFNYAVDRAYVARLLGVDSQPTCQQLPPYIPGYKPYCPYTLHPTPAGAWSAPDMPAARALIAASGTRGDKITIWSQPNLIYVPDFDPVGRYLVALLNRLGYRARLRSVTATNTSYNPFDSRQKIQDWLGVNYGFYPAASELIGPQWTSCQSFQPDSPTNTNVWELCDSRLDAIERNALAAESTNSPDATALWAQADRRLTDDAAAVPFVNPSTVDFVSRRVGNYQYNPQLGALLDQLWVR